MAQLNLLKVFLAHPSPSVSETANFSAQTLTNRNRFVKGDQGGSDVLGLMEASWIIIFSWDFDYPLFCQKFLPLPDSKERNIQSIDIGEQGDLSVTSCFIVFLILGNLVILSDH